LALGVGEDVVVHNHLARVSVQGVDCSARYVGLAGVLLVTLLVFLQFLVCGFLSMGFPLLRVKVYILSQEMPYFACGSA
jgi:hypothetical protein